MDSLRRAWRAWLARWFGARRAVPPHLRKPIIRRRGKTTELQFVRGVSQSQMVTRDPDRLLIDYTRTMLGALVLVPRPARVGIVGLGGGSQAKYCYRHLPEARIEVVENNTHVLALRRRFHVPDDDARFQIFLGDGAAFLSERPGRYDLLLVDAYDESGIPEALSSQAFYDDCRAALTPHGALATNLYCGDSVMHVERLQRAFGSEHVVVIEEARQSNRVAFAWLGNGAGAGEEMALSSHGQRDLAHVFAAAREAVAASAIREAND
ncbi:spermine/spermidine synthase domain-containing protein [Lysobacter tyrosinilyticus]